MSVKAKGWRRIICLLTNHLDQFSLTETGERNTNMKTLNSRGNGNTVINVSVRVVIRNLGYTFLALLMCERRRRDESSKCFG